MKNVSVILTTFNGEKTVEKTIDSILNQNGINKEFTIELIAIDDCSSDSTMSILKRKNCVVYNMERNTGGPNKGRNIGIKKATGDYICIADQDDVWEKHKLRALLPHLETVSIVTSGYTLSDKNQKKNIYRFQRNGNGFIYFNKNETFRKKLAKSTNEQNTYLGSIIYRKELNEILFEEHYGVVDFDWVLRLFHNQTSIEVCDSLYIRNVDENNLSLNEDYRKKDFYYSLIALKDYEEAYPKEVAQGYRKIHGSMARYYYLIGNMKQARFYFLRSDWNLKTLLYYITTFVGSDFVKKKFKIFG
ncbi:MAG: hypothetical protein A3H98_13835 [Bacteroidetes bacterium RIFCSPLOWO2_02_FULL_36_8]|nr:MAG: hypothetical protein A3H98_13835 [Bacteroidetes bacterium RIFCSPLOWO2_02_FULL_36_8]OFY70979.1 MAG: hypothetical protein A3G23_12755 [Bacteroidetes bacterium RIFCSPLOWO2_12_FULL_37_12]